MTHRTVAGLLCALVIASCGRPDRRAKGTDTALTPSDTSGPTATTSDTTQIAADSKTSAPDVEIVYEEGSPPVSADPFVEVIHGLDFAWEEGTALNPIIWYEANEYHMLYITGRSAFALGYAHSPDGLKWVKAPQPAITAPARTDGVQAPVVIPGTNLVMAYAYGGSATARGIYAWRREGSAFRLDPSIQPAHMIDFGANQNSLYPGNIIRHDGKYVLYSHGADAGRSVIFRATSADGVNWSSAKIVLPPGASGFDRGTTSEASAYYDTTRREWTLWYIANPSTTQPNTILGRAKSSDGIRFHSREAFLNPSWFGSEIRFIRKALEVSTPDGSYLYVTLDDSHNRTRVVRLNLRDPHLAPPPQIPSATRTMDQQEKPSAVPRRSATGEVTRLYRIEPTSPIPM
jgi:hypothetical protein